MPNINEDVCGKQHTYPSTSDNKSDPNISDDGLFTGANDKITQSGHLKNRKEHFGRHTDALRTAPRRTVEKGIRENKQRRWSATNGNLKDGPTA